MCLCRKSNDQGDIIYEGDDENDMIDLKKNLNLYDSNLSSFKFTSSKHDGCLTESEKNEARKKRKREIMFWKLVRELIASAIFFGILFQYSFSNRDNREYGYQQSLRTMFSPGFEEIEQPEQFWDWAINDLATFFESADYYNNASTGMSSFGLKDLSSNIIGYVQLRQNRIGNGNFGFSLNLSHT